MVKSIAVVSPAGRMKPDDFNAGAAALQAKGFDLHIMPGAVNHTGEYPAYLAASDEVRAADLTAAFLDEKIDLILCSRGGYGCARLLDMLDWEALKQFDKPVAGFSDITALHWAMTRHGVGTCIAGPMLKYLTSPDELTWHSFLDALDGKPVTLTLPALRPGTVSAPVLPGNLTVAASLAGSAHFPSGKDKIILLEEIGEAPYRIDRMLTQLRAAGLFDGALAVIFGRFTDCGGFEKVVPVLRDFTEYVQCPVFYGAQFGHEMPMMSFSSRAAVTVNTLK